MIATSREDARCGNGETKMATACWCTVTVCCKPRHQHIGYLAKSVTRYRAAASSLFVDSYPALGRVDRLEWYRRIEL